MNILVLLAAIVAVTAQQFPEFDILIRRGTVIDPNNNIDGVVMDIGVRDGLIVESM